MNEVEGNRVILISSCPPQTEKKKPCQELVILLKTGLRISELCGLTRQDIDFEHEVIHVNHQLLSSKETGYYIETPKTKSGVRDVPMSEEVKQAFERVMTDKQKAEQIEIDGYSGFLFLNGKGCPMTNAHYTSTFANLTKKYNKCHEDSLPKITPYTLRHTFCTRLANRNMNPKRLQYIMGHSNISITLNLYAHASMENVKAELRSMIA